MCGDSHLPPAPESNDLVAIIHPVYASPTSAPVLSRRESNDSTCPSSSLSSLNSSRSSSPSAHSHTGPISGRLRLSNQSGFTRSEFSEHNSTTTSSGSMLLQAYGGLSVRIHKYGAGAGNPVMHQFGIEQGRDVKVGVRLDLGVGGDGVVGRAVSIVDLEERVLGEGILGRI